MSEPGSTDDNLSVNPSGINPEIDALEKAFARAAYISPDADTQAPAKVNRNINEFTIQIRPNSHGDRDATYFYVPIKLLVTVCQVTVLHGMDLGNSNMAEAIAQFTPIGRELADRLVTIPGVNLTYMHLYGMECDVSPVFDQPAVLRDIVQVITEVAGIPPDDIWIWVVKDGPDSSGGDEDDEIGCNHPECNPPSE